MTEPTRASPQDQHEDVVIARDEAVGDARSVHRALEPQHVIFDSAEHSTTSPQPDPVNDEESTPPRPGRGVATFFTTINTLAAVGIAVMLTGLLSGVGWGLAQMFGWLTILITLPAGCLICYTQLKRAAFATCKTSPAAPLAIVTGTVVGGVLVGLGILTISVRDVVIMASLIFAAPMAVCQYLGAKEGAWAGIVKRYGAPRLGIGATCARCEYDLRGLQPMIACPECGHTYRFAWAAEHRPVA